MSKGKFRGICCFCQVWDVCANASARLAGVCWDDAASSEVSIPGGDGEKNFPSKVFSSQFCCAKAAKTTPATNPVQKPKVKLLIQAMSSLPLMALTAPLRPAAKLAASTMGLATRLLTNLVVDCTVLVVS